MYVSFHRTIIDPVVINKEDIIIVNGYPKLIGNSQTEVQYTVKATADGKTFLLPPSIIQQGFESSKASLESALRVKVSKVQLLSSKRTAKPLSKSPENKSGLVAGILVVILCLIFMGIVATFYIRRRRLTVNFLSIFLFIFSGIVPPAFLKWILASRSFARYLLVVITKKVVSYCTILGKILPLPKKSRFPFNDSHQGLPKHCDFLFTKNTPSTMQAHHNLMYQRKVFDRSIQYKMCLVYLFETNVSLSAVYSVNLLCNSLNVLFQKTTKRKWRLQCF